MAKLDSKVASDTANSICRRLANGFVRIYDGEPERSLLLVQLRYEKFSDAVDGIAKAAIHPDTAIATGRARTARHVESDGRTVVMDTSVGTSKADLIIDRVDIEAGSPVSITGFTFAIK